MFFSLTQQDLEGIHPQSTYTLYNNSKVKNDFVKCQQMHQEMHR